MPISLQIIFGKEYMLLVGKMCKPVLNSTHTDPGNNPIPLDSMLYESYRYFFKL